MWNTDMAYVGTTVVTLLHMILTVMSGPVRTTGRSYQRTDNSRACVSVFSYEMEVCLRRIFQLRAGRRRMKYRTNPIYLNIYKQIYCSEYSDTLQCLHDELTQCDTPDTTSVIQDRLSQPWALTSNQYCGIQVNKHTQDLEHSSAQTSKHSNNAVAKSNSQPANKQHAERNHGNKQHIVLENDNWSKADASHRTGTEVTNNDVETYTDGDIEENIETPHLHAGPDTRLKYQPLSEAKSTDNKHNTVLNVLQIFSHSQTNSVIIFKNVASKGINYLNEKSNAVGEQSSAPLSQETLIFERKNNQKSAYQTDRQASHGRKTNQFESPHQAASENEHSINAFT